MGAANVRGLQSGGAGGLKVTATVKHFAGYSESINGHDRVQAELPLRYLQDTFLPSYAGAINAGAGTVMVDSGSVNGIPATASHYLLTTQLRDRMGFKGVVISDYGDVGALATTYHMAAGLAGAAALAINAGVNMAMLPFNADQWQTAVQAGRGRPQHLREPDQPGRVADPHAEVPARPVRPPDRQRQQGKTPRSSRAAL